MTKFKAYILLTLMSIASCLQGAAVNGLIISEMTTLEKRFGFNSATSGLIISSDDVGNLLAMFLVTCVASTKNNNKILWISVRFIFFALGSLLISIPHFTVQG